MSESNKIEEEKTEVDALWFLSSKKPKPTSPISSMDPPKPNQPPKIDIHAETYKITNNKKVKGIALVFNHYQFDEKDLSKRQGTNKDCLDLRNVLEDLNFHVAVYNDLKYGELYDTLYKVSSSDLSDYDCLIVTVMSHGEKDQIHARDHQYPPNTLWDKFSSTNCPSLIGKPKFFFIQACRGDKLDGGSKVKIQTDSTRESSVKIPSMADILIMYSTYDDHYSFRSSVNGSWFIQSLVKELEEKAGREDMMGILVSANRRIAFEYQSNVPFNSEFHEQKQIGSIVSTLTKKFYFYDSSKNTSGTTTAAEIEEFKDVKE